MAGLSVLVLPTPALAVDQPYQIINYDPSPKSVLFVVSPDKTSEQTEQDSMRRTDVFRQVLESYWNITSQTVTVDTVQTNDLESADVIVVSDEFASDPNQLLLQTIIGSEKEVIWFGFNGDYMLRYLYGLSSELINNPPRIDAVTYKKTKLPTIGGTELRLLFETNGEPASDDVQIRSTIQSRDPEKHPLVYQIDPVGDQIRSHLTVFPFTIPTYYSPQSYTNAVLDLLHDSLGEPENHPRQALLRLEDVNGYSYATPGNSFFRAYDYLRNSNIPFHVALIERYIDPIKGIDTTSSDHRHFLFTLSEMVGNNHAVVIQHGYTHQYRDEVSAIGYEFWDQTIDGPVAEDSRQYVIEKILAAQNSYASTELPTPDIWETPHYALSSLDDEVFNSFYPLRYEHVLDIGSFPFPVEIDGTIYLPENLGFIQFDWEDELPAFEKRLQRLETFRNPTLSFFWHPWRELPELKILTQMIEDEGYDFVQAYDLLEAREDSAAAEQAAFSQIFQPLASYFQINALVLLVYAFFAFGVLEYIRNRILFWRYYDKLHRTPPSLADIKALAKEKSRELPTFAIFVPARNEGLVIANTIKNLESLDYPKKRYQIVVIADERERDDDVEIYTQDETNRLADELKKRYGHQLLKLAEVPEWYSGEYGSKDKTYEKSTKGRALNYTLQTYRKPRSWKEVDYIAVLDADGRLDAATLKVAAKEILETDAAILQGPVFQVSNLSQVSWVGVMAGIELARHHLTSMMHRLNKKGKVQFLAGTNYVMRASLLKEIGGWDRHALVEDAELAIRAYLHRKEVARPLWVAEIEQTPASFSVYRRQRERWARGHFQLLPTIIKSDLGILTKFSFTRKIVFSQFRFIIDVGMPVLALIMLFRGYFLEIEPWLQGVSIALMTFGIFIWDMYGHGFRQLVKYSDLKPTFFRKLVMSVRLFVSLPLIILIQMVPRVHAIYNVLTGASVGWYKTERTKEMPLPSKTK